MGHIEFIVVVSIIVLLIATIVKMAVIENDEFIITLVCQWGKPIRVFGRGIHWVWPFMQAHYSYSLKVLKMSMTVLDDEGKPIVHADGGGSPGSAEIYTPQDVAREDDDLFKIKKGEKIDEMILYIKSTMYAKIDRDHCEGGIAMENNKIARLWNLGISPARGQTLSADQLVEKVKKFCAPFVYAVQREVPIDVGKDDDEGRPLWNWKKIIYRRDNFAKEVSDKLLQKSDPDDPASDPSKETNPFRILGIDSSVRYIITDIDPPKALKDALPLLAIAKNKGEGLVQEAEDQAKAIRVVSEARKEYIEVFALEQVGKSGSGMIFTGGLKGIFTELLGGSR